MLVDGVPDHFWDGLWNRVAAELYFDPDASEEEMSKYQKLHEAIADDDVETVETLVRQGVNVNVVHRQETAFTWAAQCKNFQCANVIMSSKLFKPNAGNQFDRTPLFMAAKQNRPDFVRRLLDLGAKLTIGDVRGVTCLSACAWNDSSECAEILIQHGANVDQPDIAAQTPLYRACLNCAKNVVKVLLDNSCDVDLLTTDKRSPLMAALSTVNNLGEGRTYTNVFSICEMLIAHGCDMNAQDEGRRTALHHTVETDDVYGMCFLASHGCDLELRDKAGYTAFQTALLPKRPRFEMARLLVLFGVDGTAEMPNPKEQDSPTILPLTFLLHTRPKLVGMDGATKLARKLLLKYLILTINPNTFHPHKYPDLPPKYQNVRIQTLSYSWFRWKDLDFHKQLREGSSPTSLEKQARLKVRQLIGNKNHVAKINSLPLCTKMKKDLNLGHSTTTQSVESVSQLHVAIHDFQNETVEKSLENHTCTAMRMKNNQSALTLAIEIGNMEAAMMIARRRIKPGAARANPREILMVYPMPICYFFTLHVAARHGMCSLLRHLLKLGCDVDLLSKSEGTPLKEAVREGHFDTAVLLIQHGADVAINGQGVPILHLCAASGSKEMTELLLSKGLSVNTKDIFGNTPLHVAASKGTEYLNRDIDLPALYADKTSAVVDRVRMMLTLDGPVYTKKVSGHLETVKCLLKAGVDTNARNKDSKSALMKAVDSGDADIVRLLRVAF